MSGNNEDTTRLENLLLRFAPKEVARRAIANPETVQLGGKKQEVTVLFADIRGFTPLSEVWGPDSLMDILNRHFEIAGPIITQRGGTITQFSGDMIMALFNAPNEQTDHPLRAVDAGLAMQAALARWQEESFGLSYAAEFGIGINTGTAVVGYLGFHERLDYTAIGEAINVAARLSSMAQGSEILLGPQTYQAVHSAIRTEMVGPLRLKGKIAPIITYRALAGLELAGGNGYPEQANREADSLIG
jgi:adenylate cyclase